MGGGGCGDDEADPDCTGVDGSLPPGTDTTKPNGGFKVSLDLKKSFKRRAIKKGFKVKVRVKIPGSLVRASIVKAPRKKGAREGSFKFAKKRKTAAKAGLVTLTLKPGRKARQKLRRALDAKGKVKLRMRVLVDPPGAIKAATKRRNFTLKTG